MQFVSIFYMHLSNAEIILQSIFPQQLAEEHERVDPLVIDGQ